MTKLKIFFIVFYRLVTFSSVIFVAWKVGRQWQAGCGKKSGQAIDALAGDAADKLERVVIALDDEANSGLGKELGKDLDEVLIDTKKMVGKTNDFVKRAIKNTI
jgi:hypothetical protein